MRAIAEITGAVLRVYEDDDAVFGMPFAWSCTVVGHEGLAILKGVSAAPTPSIAVALRKELRQRGFSAMTWTRYDAEGRRLLPDVYAPINPQEPKMATRTTVVHITEHYDHPLTASEKAALDAAHAKWMQETRAHAEAISTSLHNMANPKTPAVRTTIEVVQAPVHKD